VNGQIKSQAEADEDVLTFDVPDAVLERAASAERLTAMRLPLFILGVFAAVVCIENSAEANWCPYYNLGHGGSRNCGFKTHHECLAAVRGVGGSCAPSPYGHHRHH
jgi:hypothetical protein